MRRLLIEEPASRAAPWSRRVAVFAWLSVAVALLLGFFGRLKPFEALAAVIACGGLALIAVLLAFIAFAAGWRNGARGMPSAVTGLLLGLGLLAYPVGTYLRDLASPSALDITTDPATPPAPLPAMRQPASGDAPALASTIDAGAPKAITPLLLDQPMNEALALALRAAGMNGWHVSTIAYPRPPLNGEARFAATVPSFLVRWPSDAIVRLTQTEDGVRVDVRLIARQPWSLLHGGNADITAYFDRLEALVFGKPLHAGR